MQIKTSSGYLDNSNMNIDSLIGNKITQGHLNKSTNQNLPDININKKQVFENEFKVKVYPNPASSNIIIGYESQTEGVFKLFNALGDILISTTLSKDNTKTQIRIDGIANGVYLYEIEFAGMKRTIDKITIIK